MIDVTVPEGALKPDAEDRLMKEVTDILIRAEGFGTKSELVQGVSVAFLHRPASTYVGGVLTTDPRYRVVPSVPEGKYSDEAVRTLVREITEAFASAEGCGFDDVASRVWIFPTEVPEGRWGGRGLIRSVVDIQAFLGGEHERAIGEQLLTDARRAKALELVEAVADVLADRLCQPSDPTSLVDPRPAVRHPRERN